MSYTGTDGRLHISEAEENDMPAGQFFVIDSPYPDPKYYPGGQQQLTAVQQWIQDHQGSYLSQEIYIKNPDGTDAWSQTLVEIGNADGITKDWLWLVWSPVRSELRTVPFV